jgi:rod shape-determining protein MreB
MMSFFSPKLGIDLGTTTTLVYVPEQGVVLHEPSVVAVSLEDNRVLAVGSEAKTMIGKTPDTIVAYRPMKDGVIANYHVTETMLRYYMKKALGGFALFRPDVVISVPAGVTSTERRAVVEAAVKAGAKNAYVVKEPVLAAVGAGVPIYEPRGHVIADIGGGTIDVAVISLGGIVASTSVKCAGNRLDKAIQDYVKKRHNIAIGEKTAEEIKIQIGSALPLEEDLVIAVRGRETVSGLPQTIELGTGEIVKAYTKELREMIGAIKYVLQETPPELASDIIDHGVILTGGSSQLRNLSELILRRTGVKARLAEHAPLCVARGTGIVLTHLDTYKKSVTTKR